MGSHWKDSYLSDPWDYPITRYGKAPAPAQPQYAYMWRDGTVQPYPEPVTVVAPHVTYTSPTTVIGGVKTFSVSGSVSFGTESPSAWLDRRVNEVRAKGKL